MAATLNELVQNLTHLENTDAVRRKDNSYARNTEGGIIALSLSDKAIDETLVLDEKALALEHLYLRDNKENKVLKEVLFKVPLPRLKYLDISDCALTALTIPAGCTTLEQVYVQGNQLQNLVFQGDCPNLTLLDASKNQLTDFNLPSGFRKLAYLYLGENPPLEKLDLPPLPVLDTLHLAKSNLPEVLVEWLKDNPKLTSLYLDENPLPDDIRGFVENDYTFGNKNCLVAIQQYFRDLDLGQALDNEYKTLLIGNGNVGKSCLVHRLVHNKFKKDWDSTHGIALEQYPHDPYIFNLWDFGGQDIYHATHRLFMKSNALYLALWDTKTEEDPFTERFENGKNRQYDNYPLNYWLDYAKSQGENSPIIVIQTKTTPDTETDLPDIRERYKKQRAFLDFKHIDSAIDDWDDNGYNDLLTAMRKAVKGFKRQQHTPKNRAALRQELRERQKKDEKQMSLTAYLDLAKAMEDPMSVLENWLVKTGVVFYQKGLFNDAIILDQAWAIEAIYAIFRRTSEKGRDNALYYMIQNRHGTFTGDDLQDIWEKYSTNEQKLFISFMLSCDICFETTKQAFPDLKEEDIKNLPIEKRHFVAPQLLHPEKPKSVEDTWLNRKTWYLRYQHDFLHDGIIQSFIVRTQTLAEMRDIWKMGISLRENEHLALVECQNKAITVRVTEGGKDLLNKIRNLLDKLQDKKGIESVSLDGKNYVILTDLKDYPNDTIKAASGEWVKVKDFHLFLNRDEKVNFEKHNSQESIKNTLEMTTNDVQNQVRNLVSQAKTDAAIQVISNWAIQTANRRASDDIAMINGTWQKLKSEEIVGIAKDADTRRNTINHNILHFNWSSELVEMIPQAEPKQVNKPASPQPLVAMPKILFLGANPLKQKNLQLQREYFEISERLKKEKQDDKFEMDNRMFTRKRDFMDAIIDFKPNIIHFAGHGKASDEATAELSRAIGIAHWADEGGLIFHDRDYQEIELVNAEDLEGFFENFVVNRHIPIDIVLLNACYSATQAKAIAKHVKYVIGMRNTILDDDGIEFSYAFYGCLARGESPLQAYNDGKSLVGASKARKLLTIFIDGEELGT